MNLTEFGMPVTVLPDRSEDGSASSDESDEPLTSLISFPPTPSGRLGDNVEIKVRTRRDIRRMHLPLFINIFN